MRISRPQNPSYHKLMLGDDSYHMHDFNLFHMNVRENAVARSSAFLSRPR